MMLSLEPRPRTPFLRAVVLLAMVLSAAPGCTEKAIRSQSPEDAELIEATDITLVGDVAVPFGMQPITVEGIALVTGLNGAGADVPPSAQRDQLVADMKKRGVRNPNQVLASRDTAMVIVRGYIRPGAMEGDAFDVEVRVPTGSEATSLRGGWMLETRLREFAVLGGSVREGHVLAIAQGPIMVDPEGGQDAVVSTRGRILGGARTVKARPMALVLRQEHQSTILSAHIGTAIGKRFHTYDAGIQKGVANPKNDQYIELAVHPRYKHNIFRYLQVVRMVPLRESTTRRSRRLQALEKLLMDPISASRAALQLEAIGNEGIIALKKGLHSESTEVQFYSAEALAYLGEKEAAEPLSQIARNEPAFRVFALTALGSLDEIGSYDALRDLIDVASVETRYGAFRALWIMDAGDPFVKGELLGGQFSYHVLDSTGPAVVHVTRSFRPEIVLFGQDQRVLTPLLIEAGPRILIHSEGGSRVTVSKLAVNEPEQRREVSNRLDEIIRAVVEVGGNYPDVVQMLQKADTAKALEGRFAVDALPEGGRIFTRGAPSNSWGDDKDIATAAGSVTDPTAIESDPNSADKPLVGDDDAEDVLPRKSDEKTKAAKASFFSRLNPWSKKE